MTRGSLRLRLLLAGAISVLAAVTLSGFGLTLLFERHVERRVEAELSVHLDRIVAGLDRGATGTLILSNPPGDPRFAEPLSGLYWQVQAGGTTLRSRSLWDSRLVAPPDAVTTGAARVHRVAGPNGAKLIAVERSLSLPPRLGGGMMRAVVAVDSSDVAAAARAFGTDLLPYLVLIAGFLIAAAYAQVSVGLRPLATVRMRLSAIRHGKAIRLGQGFPDEILPLATELDALLDAREAQIEQARKRAGDLAHGLKTPLQVLAGDVERLRTMGESHIADEIEQIATSMRRHVDRELARARMAVGGREALASIADVVERVVSVIVRTPAGGKLHWSVDIPPGWVGRIDPDDLAEAMGNLIENASRYARQAVSIRARRDAALIAIIVADDGPGIAPDHLDDALSRGGQLDRSGSGAGLGLAIVGDIAEAWNGQLELRNSAAGLEAEFRVPAVAGPMIEDRRR